MFSNLPKLYAFAVLLGLGLGGATAFAQESDELEPQGLELGVLRFHPGAFVETIYDSNYFYQDGSEVFDNDYADVLVIKPGLSARFELPNPGQTEWSLTARASWEQYAGLDNEVDKGGVEARLDTALTLFREGMLAVKPRFAYSRVHGPADDYLQRNYNQHSVEPGLEFVLQPEGGAIFSQRLGWDLRARFFDDISDLDKLDNHFIAVTKWNFLPQTAINLMFEQHVVSYLTELRTPIRPADFELRNIDSTPFRVLFGLTGLLLDRLDVTLLGGYGYTFYGAGANAHVPMGRVELGYKWVANTRLALGYVYDFADSSFGNYYLFHRFYASLQARFLHRFELSINPRINLQTFTEVEGFGERYDTLYEVDVSLAYVFVPGLTARLAYILRGDDTDFGTVVDGVSASAAYIKHLVVFNLAYEY